MGVLCIYRPPDCSIQDNLLMLEVISHFLTYKLDYNIFLGDFNFPDISWPNSAITLQSKTFLNFCQDNFLMQHVNVSTRIASNAILDLVLSTPGTSVSQLSVNEEFGSSDHSIIQLSVKAKPSCRKRKIYVRKMKNADWTRFREMVGPSEEWSAALLTKDIDLVWNRFINTLNSALDKVAPYRYISIRNFISNSKIRTAFRHKRRRFRDLCQDPTSVSKFSAYIRSKIIAKNLVEQDLISREARITGSPDVKFFWSYVNRRLSNDPSIKLINHSGSDICNPEAIANVFNDYFASIFSDSSTHMPTSAPMVLDSDTSMNNICLTVEDVFKVLRYLPPKTSIDADGLSYKILKEGGSSLGLQLFQLFSLSLETSRIPSSWKAAIVTPIFKKGSKLLVSNYRPVSVTSCCSLVLERIVKNNITNFLLKEHKITDSQHGFTTGKSTDTILIKFYDYVTNCVDRGLVVDSIFFDFRKAFDTVPHNVLLLRLHSLGIRGSILSWFTDFFRTEVKQLKSSIPFLIRFQ